MECIGLELYAKTKKQGAMYLLIFVSVQKRIW